MKGVDDAVGAAVGSALHALGELQIRVHASFGRDEPGVEVIGCFACVRGFAGEEPRSGEGGHLNGESDHDLAMVVEIAGIAAAVAVDVGAVRAIGIGP